MKPILMNTEMVRAILDERKTVTRRALKYPFEIHSNGYITKPRGDERLCPYKLPYERGDILYVRETWSTAQSNNCFANSGEICPHKNCEEASGACFPEIYIYKASHSLPVGGKWHPSIHMPKEAARIFLRVTDVHVERLQEITEEEAISEGCHGIFTGDGSSMGSGWEKTPIDEFAEIWDSTIKPADRDKYGWAANPMVSVTRFERVEKMNGEE